MDMDLTGIGTIAGVIIILIGFVWAGGRAAQKLDEIGKKLAEIVDTLKNVLATLTDTQVTIGRHGERLDEHERRIVKLER